MPSPNAELGMPGWTGNPRFSQLWNEQSFIHCLRMVAMGINQRFQEAVKKVPKLLLLSSACRCSLQQNIKHAINVLMSSPLPPSSSIFPTPAQVCIRSQGEFKETAIKGYVRMRNKTISKDDHYYEAYPRFTLCC